MRIRVEVILLLLLLLVGCVDKTNAARVCEEEAERISDNEGHLGLGIDAARTASRCAAIIRALPNTGTTPEEE